MVLGHRPDGRPVDPQDLNRFSRPVPATVMVYTRLIAPGSRVIKRGLRYLVDRRDRRDKSLFRIGWDWMERCLALNKQVPLTFKPVS